MERRNRPHPRHPLLCSKPDSLPSMCSPCRKGFCNDLPRNSKRKSSMLRHVKTARRLVAWTLALTAGACALAQPTACTWSSAQLGGHSVEVCKKGPLLVQVTASFFSSDLHSEDVAHLLGVEPSWCHSHYDIQNGVQSVSCRTPHGKFDVSLSGMPGAQRLYGALEGFTSITPFDR